MFTYVFAYKSLPILNNVINKLTDGMERNRVDCLAFYVFARYSASTYMSTLWFHE